MQKYFFTAAIAACAVGFFSLDESAAGDVGPIASIEQASAQLLVGAAGDDGTVRAALHLALAEGFKTYWHVPGDGGLPPSIRMDGEVVDVRLPAPARYIDAYGEALGYKGEVTLAFELPAPESGVVNLDMLVGVCAEICIPFIAKLAAPVPNAMMPRTKFALDDAFDALPDPFDDELAVTDAQVSANSKDVIALSADVALQDGVNVDDAQLFVRLPGKNEFFAQAAELTSHFGGTRAEMDVITYLSVEELVGRSVVFTLVSGGRSVEGELVLR
ncbi:MAG: protein-disulfide reductase DsbD domain-containing protein [Pseudomonadota bacterium]